MAQISSFKEYQRGRRQALVETNFSKGMYYTNGPVDEGYVKWMVNFNLSSNKLSLLSRPGLRTSELVCCQSEGQLGDSTQFFAGDTQIFDAKDCIEEGVEYRQIILGNAAVNKIWVITINKNEKDHERIYPESLLDVDDESSIASVYEISKQFLEDYEAYGPDYVSAPSFDEFEIDFLESKDSSVDSQSCIFHSVELSKIHDILLENSGSHSNVVGTFGFNNNYYFFSTNGKLYRTVFDSSTLKYVFEAVDEKEVSASEAVSFGYNMLEDNPYVFEDGSGESTVFQMEGILPYDAKQSDNGKLMMTPKKNQQVWFRCNYNVPAVTDTYKIVWEWKELTADEWIQLDEQNVIFTNLPVLEIPFKAPSENIMIRVSAYKGNNEYVERAMTVGFDFSLDEHGTVNNLKQENYDLAHAAGMYYWKNRLVLFGVVEDPTILFISDLNEPSYFPYPNNITVFDQPIVAVEELMDNLIVFTTDKIYQVKLSDDGVSWITEIIQSNLRIDPADRHLILTVRNMLFFKSGNFYYMVVPKATSTTGALTLAPISTPMTDFFNNFKANLSELLYSVFSFNDSFRMIDYYNFLDYEDVHNVYVFRMMDEDLDEDKYGYFHFDVIYNTTDRTWRTYTYQTAHKIFPYQFDAAKSGVFAFTDIYNYESKIYRNIQLLKFDSLNSKDFYIPGEYMAGVLDDHLDGLRALALNETDFYYFRNYQFVDTGYRNDQFHRNKRYRELQFQINNLDYRKLKFGMDFLIDGESRMTFIEYNIEQVIDEDNSHYGTVYIEPTPIMNIPLNDLNIIPDEIAFRANHWTLDESLFPEVNLWKIRVPVSGKGMAPRVKIASYNESRFEITSFNWIYRIMYMR